MYGKQENNGKKIKTISILLTKASKLNLNIHTYVLKMFTNRIVNLTTYTIHGVHFQYLGFPSAIQCFPFPQY